MGFLGFLIIWLYFMFLLFPERMGESYSKLVDRFEQGQIEYNNKKGKNHGHDEKTTGADN